MPRRSRKPPWRCRASRSTSDWSSPSDERGAGIARCPPLLLCAKRKIGRARFHCKGLAVTATEDRTMTAALRNYHGRMQRVLDHIDRHLDDELDLDRISGIAAFSKFHFHRQFSATFRLTLHRYIQLARMKRARWSGLWIQADRRPPRCRRPVRRHTDRKGAAGAVRAAAPISLSRPSHRVRKWLTPLRCDPRSSQVRRP